MEQNFDCLKLENQLCFPLYAASREILRKYTPFLKELDLTYTQYIVMMVMWESKKLTVGDLGKKLFLDTGTLSPLLKAMEQKGLLTRTREKGDERVVKVQITPAGEELRERAVKVPAEMGKCISLSPEDAKNLYSILYKILGA
ncbi:MAG: MarR family transcriptional regulator [Treponema sp.]|nr:MarR family transcriptional regulator [Treponema sp.]